MAPTFGSYRTVFDRFLGTTRAHPEAANKQPTALHGQTIPKNTSVYACLCNQQPQPYSEGKSNLYLSLFTLLGQCRAENMLSV